MSHDKPGGNTRPPGRYQLYNWCFTIKHYGEPNESKMLWNTLRDVCKKFVFQLEKGEGENEYLHYQGVMSLERKEYFATVKNLLGEEAHIEGVRNWHAAVNYCSKVETRVDGPWDQDYRWLNLIKILRPWQQDIVDLIATEPDDRTIYWIWSKPGKNGKTVFTKYLVANHRVCAFSNASSKDIAYALPSDPRTVVFNLPRSQENYFNYAALEQVKDGLMFSCKYKSRTLVFNSPHVIVFANWPPNLEELSVDRWKVINIDDTMEKNPCGRLHLDI